MYTTLFIAIDNRNTGTCDSPDSPPFLKASISIFFTSLSSINEYEFVCPIYTTLTHRKATYFSIFMMFV